MLFLSVSQSAPPPPSSDEPTRRQTRNIKKYYDAKIDRNNRRYYVVPGGDVSDIHRMQAGLPQGRVYSEPLTVCYIYTTDVPKYSTVGIVTFADYTIIHSSDKHPNNKLKKRLDQTQRPTEINPEKSAHISLLVIVFNITVRCNIQKSNIILKCDGLRLFM